MSTASSGGVRLITLLATLWCWSVGLLTFIALAKFVLLATVFVPFPRYDPLLKWACRTILRVCFIRVRVEGEIPKTALPCLFLGNHVNIFDPLIYGGYLPGPVRGVELASHFRWPVYGWVIRRIGNVPIEQAYRKGIRWSYRAALAKLRQGISIAILPEGHRTRDGRLLPFARAPFAFAREAGVPVVPVALVGAYRINRKGTLRVTPGTVRLRIGRPILPDEVRRLDAAQLRDRIRGEIQHMLGETS